MLVIGEKIKKGEFEMYYKLTFNYNLIDESIKEGTYPIYARFLI